MSAKRRQACPQIVLQLWNGITFVRQQKQIPNLTRLSGYMKRMHEMSESDVELQLKFAVHDGLIVVKTTVGCKGTKVGVEQDGYRILEEEMVKDDHDWYCFECHKGGDVVLCSSCHRVYHKTCLTKYNAVKYVCDVCKNHQNGKYNVKLNKKELNKLLHHTCARLKEKTKELHRIPHTDEEKWRHDFLIYQQMDLVTMEHKMRNDEYQQLEEYYADALQIVHNVNVYFGSDSLIADMAHQMLFDCDYDLNEISQCRECYRMSNEKDEKLWFCQPCNPPHQLVFAKQKGFPFWPAKVIKKKENSYDVRFFGGFHQRADVNDQYVKPISTSLQQLGVKRTASLKKALKELQCHQTLVSQFIAGQSANSDSEMKKTVKDISKILGEVTNKKTRQLVSDRKNKVLPISKQKNKLSSNFTEISEEDKNDSFTSVKQFNSGSSKQKAVPTKKRKLAKNDSIVDGVLEKKSKFLHSDKKKSSSNQTKSPLQDISTAEEINIVSSSCQDLSFCRATVATQTPKRLLLNSSEDVTETASCNCKEKFENIFSEVREKLNAEHKADKDKALRNLSEKLQKEMEEEKQNALSVAFIQFHEDLGKVQAKVEDETQIAAQQQNQKLIEQHKQEISATKKKQWCYNCELEAIYHCCWNTSYCSVECQQAHWHKEHKRTCRRKR